MNANLIDQSVSPFSSPLEIETHLEKALGEAALNPSDEGLQDHLDYVLYCLEFAQLTQRNQPLEKARTRRATDLGRWPLSEGVKV